jgi:two-component system, sensor histidine kinase YesM
VKKIKSNGLKNRAMKQMTTLIILAMIIMVAVFYGVVHSRTIKNQGRNQAKSLANMEAYLNNYFEEVDAIAKNVNYNYYLQNYLETATDNENAYTDPSVGKNMRAYEMSSQAFSDTLLSRPDISSMMVFGRKKVLLNKSLYSYRNVVMDYSGLEWYQGAIQKPYDMVITGPNRHQFFDTDDETISLSREIQDYEDGTFLGVILINLNMNKITEICASFQENTSGALGILNESGEAVYLNGDAGNVAVQDIDMKELSEILEQYPENSFRIRLGGTKYLITKERMDSTGWYLINILPYSWLLSDLWKISMVIVLAVAGTLVVTLLSLDRILTNVIQPLKKLERHMARVTIENMNEQVNITTDDEIGHLAGNFNSMLERIENLKEQVVEEQEDKRRYELQALQAQINPHFLYNTLDSIIWMAETQDSNIVAMTEALAKLFRISLNKGNEEILLKKEIEHVKNYLIIQSMRYADKFTFEICVEPEVEKCRIIKLILQPIVENCIYHGIKKKRGSGHIRIRAFREECNLIIKVEDDGCGISQEMCRKMLSYEVEPENISGSGIGVKNVNERIQLRFGKEYGLSYQSEEGKGTTVTYLLHYST